MPFKRAGWLQPPVRSDAAQSIEVSMPFKRAGWLQRAARNLSRLWATVSMPFKRAGWLQLPFTGSTTGEYLFQCPLSGLVGCNNLPKQPGCRFAVSMPFKRAGWLQLLCAATHRRRTGFNAL